MRFFFGRRNNDSGVVVERPKSVHQVAKELRMQKIKEYETKMQAAKVAKENEKNDLLLSVLPEPEKATSTTPALVDDATEANSPVNSDNEDPTINDDDENEGDDQQPDSNVEENQRQQQSPPGSPLSVLSMGTKPTLIHPPRSITRKEDDNNDGTDDDNKNPLSMLCGCI